jgi:prolyl-tRNA synthetase
MKETKKQEFTKEYLIKKSVDFSQWYTDVILKSEMADYAPVKGCQVIMPYGYAIWETIQRVLDQMLKNDGIENAYFPLLIPQKSLQKEQEHIEGFSPELAIVTIGGGETLTEKLVLRPTSETIIYEMYAKWIKSWRDLPLRINQWANVVRWEKRTRLFLRTTEFLWQEGHTVHSTDKEALKETQKAIERYIKIYQEYFAIDGIWGKKSEQEKFPGAVHTFTYEMLMPDNKALQGCTSHYLGQNFAKAFHIQFLGKDGANHFPFQTCWGFSTRSLGALIMAHGDDNGLVLPPLLAPVQVVIVPILQGKNIDKKVLQMSEKLKNSLQVRVYADTREEYSSGWKFNHWELKGVPLRIEIGPREVQQKKATLARRDNGEKITVPLTSLPNRINKILQDIQKNLLQQTRKYLYSHIHDVKNYSEFQEIMEQKRGLAKAFWCEHPQCEQKIKEETKATTRCLAHNAKPQKGKCVYCQKPASHQWIFGIAY